MIFKHPCKFCIVKPMCDRECSIIINYLKQFTNNIVVNICVWFFVIFLFISLSTILFLISKWCLLLLPFLWPISHFIMNSCTDILEEFDGLELVLYYILLPFVGELMILYRIFEAYFNKYSPRILLKVEW